MNQASLDRGFGRCIVHHTYKATLKKYANRAQDRIVAPEERRDKSHLIESDGLAVVGRVINPGATHQSAPSRRAYCAAAALRASVLRPLLWFSSCAYMQEMRI